MPHKKLPVHSKLIAVIVGFIATLYLLFVGFSYLKAQNDFKPYHNLAVELNAQLGGGYTITETKRCGIETPNCPSAELEVKNLDLKLADAIRKKLDIENLIIKKGFIVTDDQNCRSNNGDISFCGLTASDKSKNLEILVSIGNDSIGIDIHRL